MADDPFENPPQLIGGDLSQFEKAHSLGNDFSMEIPRLHIPKLEFPAPPKLDIEQPTVPTAFPSAFKKEKTVGGFAKNFIDDATETLKGLGHLLFVDLPEAAIVNPARAAAGAAFDVDKKWREKYTKDWSDRINKFMADPAGRTAEGGGVLLHALADPYWDFKNDSFKWDFWYERPFTVLADAATLASLGAGSAGKAANVAGKATRVGEGLTKVATTLGSAEKVLNPINWVVQGGKKVAAPFLESFGIGEHSSALTKIVSEARAESAAERAMMKDIKAETGPSLLRKATSSADPAGDIMGATILDEVPGTDFKYNKNFGGATTGALTPNEAANILEQATEQVKKRAKFKTNIEEIDAGKLPDDAVMRQRIQDAFIDTKWRGRTLDRINSYLLDNKIISPTRISGYEPVNLEGLKRYYNTTLNMIDEYKKGYNNAIAAGLDDTAAINAGAKATKEFAESLKNLDMGQGLMWAPKHVAKYLKHEFAPALPGIMDSFFKYWAPAVTSLKFPMYQAQVLAGNTGMAILYGVTPREWGLVKKMRQAKVFGPELREIDLLQDWANGEGAFGKWRQAYLDFAEWAGTPTKGSDARLRQLIATHKISNELKTGILGSVPTGKALDDAIIDVLKSKSELRAILDDIKNLRDTEAAAETLAKETAGQVLPPPTSMRQVYPGSENVRQGMRSVLGPRGGLETENAGGLKFKGGKRAPEGPATPKEGIRQPQILSDAATQDAENFANAEAVRKLAEARIPDLQKKVAILEKAMEEGNRWTGNVLALHPFERNVLKRIIPFYTYTKAMTALAFSAPILYPKRMFMLNRLAALTSDIMHDENAPEWVQGYVPFGFDGDGNIMAFRLESFNPFSGVRGEEFGDLPIPGMIDPTRNPIVKLVYEAAGGTPHWSKRAMSPGDYAVRYGDGSTYEYQKDGTFKKVLPQPNILKTALYTFPQIQAAMELGDAYVTNDRGQPILGPDGKPKFPRELWTRILPLLGARGSEYKPEELKDQMQRKGTSILKEFRNALRHERDPERRQQYIDILKDAQQSEHFRIENQ